MPRRQSKPPPSGPVRRITDPKEFARIAQRHVTAPVPCTGKTIRLRIKGQEEEVSDHHIQQLLADNLSLPEELQLTRKERAALTSFRVRLSQGNPFSSRQKKFLISLVTKARDPKPSNKIELSPAQTAVVRQRIKAVFKYMEAQKKSNKISADTIADFFSPVDFTLALSMASEVLRPYGLEGEAKQFVLDLGSSIMRSCAHELQDWHPKEWGRILFRNFARNIVGGSYVGERLVLSVDSTLLEHTKRLEKELLDVPHHASEHAREILSSCSEITHVSIRDIPAGSPGSRKGGSSGHK